MGNTKPLILAFSGSLRAASWNRMCAAVAADGARDAGAEIELLDPAALDLPLFNEDAEAASGIPDKALALRAQMQQADGFILGCPEYNGSFTGALKNALDWASRPRESEQPLACFKGKTAALVAASPGKLGGIRALPEYRRVLSGIGVLIIPNQMAVGAVHEQFDDAGAIKPGPIKDALLAVGRDLATTTRALKAGRSA